MQLCCGAFFGRAVPFERSECESECCGASTALEQLRNFFWREDRATACCWTCALPCNCNCNWRAVSPRGVRASQVDADAGAPAPSEPCAVSVAPAAHDQCPTSAGSTCARSSSPSPCAQMQMLLAELRASAAPKSSQVASWTLDQVGFADAASAASASSPDADASLCARVSSSTHCHCTSPVPFMPFPAVPLAPPPGHMLDPIPLPAPAPHPLRSANGELSISHTNTNTPTVDLLASMNWRKECSQ